MKHLRKITVLLFTIILAAAIPVAAQAKGGGGGGRGGAGGSKGSNSSKSSNSSKNQPTQSQPAPKIDINSATADSLTTLPGITADIAAKIIAGRPFKSVSDLKSKKILTSDQYNAIKSLTTATKPATPPKTPPASTATQGSGSQ